MGAFEDAISRIRGPSIEDLLAEDSPTWEPTQSTTTTTTTSERPLGVPSLGSISRTPTTPQTPEPSTTTTPGPSSPPSSLTRPPRPRRDESLGEQFLLDPIFSPVDRAARSPYFPMAARTVGQAGGGFVGGVFGMPYAGAAVGGALVEKLAAEPAERLQGQDNNPLLAPLNVGVGTAGGSFTQRANQLVRPALRVGTELVEATGLNELWEVARGLFEERKVNWQQVADAGGNPWNLVALPFGAGEAIRVNAAMKRLRERRAELPATLQRTHQETGGATFSYDGRNRVGEEGLVSVSIYPERSERIEGEVTPGHFQAFIDRNKDLLDRDPRNHIGSWWDKEAGTNFLDVVVVTPRAEGIELGKRYNQKAVFDLGTFEEINTGGTGDPIDGLPAEVNRLPRAKMKAYPDELQGLVDQGADASDRLLRWYRGSKASGTRGAVGENRAASLEDIGDTALRIDLKKKMPASDQAVRFNLAREAGRDIVEAKGTLRQEDWTARMIEKYGPTVARHTTMAWKRATSAVEKRFAAMGKRELPGVDHWAALVEHGKDAEPFYGPARATLEKVFGPDVETFLDFYAATSPRTDTDRNLQQALRWYVQWKTGSPIRGGLYPSWGEKIAAGDPNWGGNKVQAFRANLGGRGHPAGNNANRVTVDTWMQEGIGYELVATREIDPETGFETGNVVQEMPSMSELEYALNEDYIRAQADALGIPDASLAQELSWAGIRKTSSRQGGKRKGSGLAPHAIIEKRFKDGLSIFDPKTLEVFKKHEAIFAAEIDAEMLRSGRVHPEATGLGEVPEGAFDWGSGEFVKPAPKRVRKGQSGKTRLDAILPIWAMLQVAKGINTFAKFTVTSVKRFGNAIRPRLPRAWQEGRRRAFKMASAAPKLPEATPNVFTEGALPTVKLEKERHEYTQRYGKAGTLMANLLEKHGDKIDQAVGRVQDDAELQRMADQVKADLVGLTEKFGRGNVAATAAEIKHVRDLAYTLDERLKAKIDERAAREADGTWSPADEAELADLELDYVSLHAIRKGTAAEAGRALRAHQTAAQLRNRDLDALLNYAKNQGLDHTEIAKVFEQHKDPLSRAQAIQTLTWTPTQLYVHARYWTMLADPTTWYMAAQGNTTDGLIREFGKLTGSAADAIFHRGNRWVYSREFNPRQSGSIRGMMKGFRRAYHTFTEGVTAESIASGKAPPTEFFAEKPVLGVLANLPFRALSASDAFATTMFGEAEMHGFAYARAMKHARDRGLSGRTAEDWALKQQAEWLATPPEWLLLHTRRMTEQLSLQSGLGATGKMLQGFLHRLPKPVQTFVLPFISTGINAVKQASKKVPIANQLGFTSRYVRAAQTREGARELARKRGIRMTDVLAMEKSGGEGTFQESLQREAAVTRGESHIGTAIMLALPLLVMGAMGDVRGDPPKDQAERERMQAEGPFNHTRIGRLWIDNRTFGSLEPILRAVGNAKQAFDVIKRRKVEGVNEGWQRASESFVATLQGLPMSGPLRSLNGLLSLMDSDIDAVAAKSGRMFRDATIVGTMGEKVQKYVDPYERRTENFIDPLLAAFKPSWYSPRLDPMGDPVERKPFPFAIGSQPNDLLNEAAKAGVAMTSPNERTIKIGEREVELSLRDRRVLNRALGLANRAAMKRLIGNREQWGRIPPEGRHAALLKLRDQLRGAVKDIALSQVVAGQPLQMQALARPVQGILEAP